MSRDGERAAPRGAPCKFHDVSAPSVPAPALPPAPSVVTDARVRAAYAEGAGIYRVVPRGVVRPESADAAAAAVLRAAKEGTPLIPRGAGSGMPGGNVGEGVILDLSSLGGVRVDRAAGLAHAGAGTTWREVTEAARAHGLRVPPDPSSGAFATSGGMAATNAAGPRTVRFGSVRRWIEALDVVTADGARRTVRRGGGAAEAPWRLPAGADAPVRARFPRVRKNSSGYALDAFLESGDELDLLIGSEGTLAVVTGVTWRLEPVPPDVAGLALGFRELAALADAVPFLLSLNPSAVELMDRTLLDFVEAGAGAGAGEAGLPEGLACLLLVEFERETAAAARGVVGDAVRGTRELAAHVDTAVDRAGLERLWAVRRLASPALARLPETRRSLQVVEDGCVPVERLGDYVAGLRAAAAAREIPVALFGHAGDGHVHVNALPDLTRTGWEDALAGLYDDVTALVVRLGGTVSGEHGDGRLRVPALAAVYGPEVTALFAAVKRAYDPRGVLNPGVIISSPGTPWAPVSHLKVGAGAAPIPDDVARRLRDVERTGGWAVPKPELAR